ncbi:MAG: hypothetical protein ACRCZ0_01865 [Cetobacterium sp.]
MKKKVRKFESKINTDGILHYEHDRIMYGDRYVFRFPNGFGASVIRFKFAYCDARFDKEPGYKSPELRTYELAILDREGELESSPLGYLDYEEVNELLESIKERK